MNKSLDFRKLTGMTKNYTNKHKITIAVSFRGRLHVPVRGLVKGSDLVRET